MAKTKKPGNLTIGRATARAIRPPCASDARWYWRAEVYDAGKPRTLWTGRGTEEEVERAVAGLIATGAPSAPATPKRGTVADLLDQWIATKHAAAKLGQLAPGTAENYELAARRLKATIGDEKLTAVGLLTLERYRDERLEDGAAPRTLQLDFTVMGAAWRWGRERNQTPDKPLARPALTVKADEHVNTHSTPTRADIARVLAVTDGWFHGVIRLLAATGCRLGEVSDLGWDDINIRESTMLVTGKTGTRTVHLDAATLAHLVALPRSADGKVWGVPKQQIDNALHGVKMRRACARAEVAYFSAHGIRRFVEDTLADAGVEIKTYAEMLGHSEEVALRHYRRARPAQKRDAVAAARLGDFL